MLALLFLQPGMSSPSAAPVDWPLWVALAGIAFAVVATILSGLVGVLLSVLGLCGGMAFYIFRSSIRELQGNQMKHERDLQELGNIMRSVRDRSQQFADLTRGDIMKRNEVDDVVRRFTDAIRDGFAEMKKEVAKLEDVLSRVMFREEYEKRHEDTHRRIAAVEGAVALNKSPAATLGG